MQSTIGLGRGATIISVAHRLGTLQHCDQIIELENGEHRRTWFANNSVGEPR